jgi:protein-L-isoaspartate(D-aspartate) O-methyltransferase
MKVDRRPRFCSATVIAAAVALCLFCACGPSAAVASDFEARRNRLVDDEIVGAGIVSPGVVRSIRNTPRHEFMPLNVRDKAYYDMALPIGWGQTISPPFIVAYMTESLEPKSSDRVLEIGTGSGYQAAVLSPLVSEVYTIEIVKPLGQRAARTLKRLKYDNVFTKVGDGYQGWPEHAPFDKIIVTCSPEKVPPKLVEQLREGGRMLVPVGERYQQALYLFTKQDGKLTKSSLLPVLFVPMTGEAEDGRQVRPDPKNPAIVNGGFEQPAADSTRDDDVDTSAKADASDSKSRRNHDEPGPAGWYYQRQLVWEQDAEAPQGDHFVTFRNSIPGRGAQALQGIAVDGREVKRLNVSLWVKGRNIRAGENEQQQPILAITFYDDNRKQAGFTWVGPWRDTFDWKRVNDTVRVPVRAREAIIQIGLSGATGEVSYDDIRFERAAR